MERFIEKQRFLQPIAKELIAKILTEKEKKGEDYCRLQDISWSPNYGIFTNMVFHELDSPYYFECSAGLMDESKTKDLENCLDWFDTNINRGNILFIADIVIFHKGAPAYIIQVSDKHKTSPSKLKAIRKFFNGHFIEVYEASALNVMCQIGNIENIKLKRIL